MAVGQELRLPEAGWRRYDNIDSHIQYVGYWQAINTANDYYGNSVTFATDPSAKAKFNFTGNKLRVLGALTSVIATEFVAIIDGVSYKSNPRGSIITNTSTGIYFEKLDLSNGEHSVELYSNIINDYLYFDAIDIDENGELLPYNPVTEDPEDPENPEQALLRVTMIDSSEREYKLPKADIDGFVAWFTRTVDTGISVYVLNKVLTNSKEYLAYDKIISFEVLPVA